MPQINGYELTSEWKASQCGETATAKKGGRKFFLKKYQTPVAPIDNGTLDARTFAHNRELFEHFLKTRKAVNSKIRTITGAGGNIIIPDAEFVYENHYMEAAEFVDGVVSEEELEGVLASLSVDVKKLLMQTAAGALSSVHKLGIVHSDLKLKNVLLVRNAAGNYVAKLIDFDSSYPLDDKPDEIVGDINYYSPELGAYADVEDDDERAEAGKKLTAKSDIFSLGLIFHIYLSGKMPEPAGLTDRLKKRKEKGKKIYCWAALNGGATLAVDSSITSIKYRSLIEDMLNIDPEKRPSAIDVLKRLREEEACIEEPWPEHEIMLDSEELSAAGIIGLKKISDGGKVYGLTYKDGKKKTVTKEELESMGMLRAIAGFCTPWEEDGFTFDEERIRSRGFVSVSRKVMGGIKGYKFFRPDSTSTFFKKEMLLAMKYAIPGSGKSSGSSPSGASPAPKPAPAPAPKEEPKPVKREEGMAGASEPWPEHAIEFDPEAIRAKGYTAFGQDTMGGVKGYSFVRKDGTKQFLRVEMVLIQKLARKL